MSQKQAFSKNKELQIHDYDYKIERTWNLLRKDTSQENITLIEKYDNLMVRLALAKATRLKHLQIILNLSRYVDKDWESVTKDDIDILVTKIMNLYSSDKGQETNSSWDHKKVLKIFFRWVKLGSREFREVGDPPETKGVKIRTVRDTIVREDLLTEDDRTKLLHACGGNQRDRAFLDCHYEAGTRPGEILSIRLRHVKFDKYGAILHVDGKTGSRPIRLVTSTPNLAKWLDVHPNKDDPEAPLWIQLEKNHYGQALTYSAAKKLLERRCRQANILKRVSLNLFRHSEATNSAKFMTEAQLRKRHGWTSYSKMPGKYTHLVNSDVDEAIFEHLGIEHKEKENVNTPKICKICDVPNSFESTICCKCGKPLDLATAIQEEENERDEKESRDAEIKRQGQAIDYLLQELKTLKKLSS